VGSVAQIAISWDGPWEYLAPPSRTQSEGPRDHKTGSHLCHPIIWQNVDSSKHIRKHEQPNENFRERRKYFAKLEKSSSPTAMFR
jgi:AMMECR1 domain-containing protein